MRRFLLGAVPVLLAAALVTARAVADEAGVEPGAAAPTFSLENQDGKKVSLEDYKGKLVVLEWVHPGCPFVVRHYKAKTMATLAEKYAGKGVVWLAINSTKDATNETNKKWVEEHSLSYPILNDSEGKTGHAYGAKTTPHMFIISKEGKVVYAGGIDDDPKGDKSDRVNYVEKALDEVLGGKAVSTPKTKSYGCSVKFKS